MLALFEELGAPERLSVLVEGESLLNDGVGVVVFSALLDEHPDIRRAELGIGERPDRAGRRERYTPPTDRRERSSVAMVPARVGRPYHYVEH